MRVFSGAVLGFLLFVGLRLLLFQITQINPHAPASISFQLGTIVFGILFGALAGYIASFIGGRPNYIAAWIVGALIAIGSIIWMAMTAVAWMQVTALLLMAPAAVVGGRAYAIRRRSREGSSEAGEPAEPR